MAILNNSNAISPSGYDVNNSLRFRSSASAYLNRTPASAGNRKTFTFSAWIKVGRIVSSGSMDLLSSTVATNTNGWFRFSIDTNNIMHVDTWGTDANTTAVFRDPSAWYHIVLAIDTTQATASDRSKLYVNGTQQTLSGSFIPQNTDLPINNTVVQTIGRYDFGTTNYFDGYMAEVNFIDGSAKTPSDFGATDTTTGVWKPKAYTGTYGTNGFYLKFSDIATTSGSNAGLGKDFSGNTNYWTTNNISVTSGTTYDAMTDSPTLTSATVANYAVLNPLIPSSVSGSAVRSISAGNLYVTNSGPNGWSAIGTTMVMTSGSGKWYWEVTCSGTTSNGTMIGIHRPFTSTSTFPSAILGYDTPPDPDGYGYYMGGNKYNNSGAGVAYGASYTAGDVIGVALDMSTAGSASITFYKNNTSQGVAFSSLTGDFFAAVSQAQANGLDINFGQRPFAYTPPTGFNRLNTFNLPDSTIKKGNTVMDAQLWTGNGTSPRTFNLWGFKPDLIWMKGRSGATDNALIDTVRGTGVKVLESNLTDAENDYGLNVSAFTSTGFTGATGSFNFSYANTNAATYVGWGWNAGSGSTSSNTSGSITSTVSVNTTAGFSIVTWTGNGGSSATVGHGLGVAPKFVIARARNANDNWWVYHQNLTSAAYYLVLNSTAAQSNATYNTWNSTAPSSSLLTLGSAINGSFNMIAYCWAEIAGFSRFGSYTGNGSTDGPFVFTGFRPKYLLIKRTDTTNNWVIQDTSRDTYNVSEKDLYADTNGAEATYAAEKTDILSNGFKQRQTGASMNANGGTYIYMAFAENPFKNALAR